jgi:hypothetical protein
LAGLQLAKVLDAILAAVLLVVVAGWSTDRPRVLSDESGLQFLGRMGLALGLLAWVGILLVATSEPTGVHHPAYEAQQNRLSVESLTTSAIRYHHQHGAFPPDVATLLATGGWVAPGSRVQGAGLTGHGRYCIIVGADLGDGRAGPPNEGGEVNGTRLIGTGSATCTVAGRNAVAKEVNPGQDLGR